jgi:hypothetical protein
MNSLGCLQCRLDCREDPMIPPEVIYRMAPSLHGNMAYSSNQGWSREKFQKRLNHKAILTEHHYHLLK